MKQLQHTLFVTDPDVKLNLNHDAIEAELNDGTTAHFPIHNIDGIVSFSYNPATPAVMERCAAEGIPFCVLSANGKFRYRVAGGTHGNIDVRMQQYLRAQDEQNFTDACAFITGKLKNEIAVLNRFQRNHEQAEPDICEAVEELRGFLKRIPDIRDVATLRGLEGIAAKQYFSVFGKMILSDEPDMQFARRSRQPPEDKVNALLSLTYTMLSTLCISALESVGLDPCLGVIHGTRPGKAALAFDLMEELRPAIADRFVLRLVNKNIIKSCMFDCTRDGVFLSAAGRKVFFSEWNKMKEREVTVKGIEKKVPVGLLPFVQAKAYRSFIMKETENYDPYLLEYAS